MNQTLRYALPLLQSGQAQKEITHNEAVARLDALVHLVVESRTLDPVATLGSAWIVAAGAAGAWAGHDGEIAVFDDAGWSFVVPRDGCIAFLRDEQIFLYHVAGAWREDWPVRSLSVAGRTMLGGPPAALARPVGGTTIDVEARAAIDAIFDALRLLGLAASE